MQKYEVEEVHSCLSNSCHLLLPLIVPVLMWFPIFFLIKPVRWKFLINDTFSTGNVAVFVANVHMQDSNS